MIRKQRKECESSHQKSGKYRRESGRIKGSLLSPSNSNFELKKENKIFIFLFKFLNKTSQELNSESPHSHP